MHVCTQRHADTHTLVLTRRGGMSQQPSWAFTAPSKACRDCVSDTGVREGSTHRHTHSSPEDSWRRHTSAVGQAPGTLFTGGIDDAMKWVSLSAGGTGGETEARETMRLVQVTQRTSSRPARGARAARHQSPSSCSTSQARVTGWWLVDQWRGQDGGRREKPGWGGQDKASESRDKASG